MNFKNSIEDGLKFSLLTSCKGLALELEKFQIFSWSREIVVQNKHLKSKEEAVKDFTEFWGFEWRLIK